jgi:hypothetical protein
MLAEHEDEIRQVIAGINGAGWRVGERSDALCDCYCLTRNRHHAAHVRKGATTPAPKFG